MSTEQVRLSGKAAEVADAIRAQIATGKLKADDALPPEGALTTTFGVSAPTMRAAMRILESEGLIRIQRGVHGGPRVLPLDVGVLARQAALYLQVEHAGLAELLEALKILEPGAVALAAQRRTDDQIAELYDCADRAAGAETMSAFSDASADFVLLLLQASGNAAIKLFGNVIARLVRSELHRELDDKPVTGANRWNAQRFQEVVGLIELGEGEAAAALWKSHMLSTSPVVIEKAVRRSKKLRRHSRSQAEDRQGLGPIDGFRKAPG
jgi:DNA-binding FadR family transcriptional regulator